MTVPEVRALVFTLLEERFLLAGISSVDALDDSFDMLEAGVLDSLGFVELIVSLEERLSIQLQTSELGTDDLSNFTKFCAFVAESARRAGR